MGTKGTTLRGLILPEAGLAGKAWFSSRLILMAGSFDPGKAGDDGEANIVGFSLIFNPKHAESAEVYMCFFSAYSAISAVRF
jgi:hypothetical protein